MKRTLTKSKNDYVDKLQEEIDSINKELLTAKPEVEKGESTSHHHIKNSNWINRVKDRIWPGKTMLINMELRTGMHRTFMISTKNDSFKFLKATYVIDNELKYFNVDSGCYAMDYHQDFSIPIKRKIPVTDVKKAVQFSNIIETENATNPYLIEDFIQRKVIEQAMRGQDFEEALKNLKLAAYIAAICSAGMLLLFVIKSGMLSSIKVPGL